LWLTSLLACSRPTEFTGISAEVSDAVATVVTVRWETSEAVSSQVRYGLDGATDRATAPTPEGTSHTAVLVGLPADAEITFAVAAGDDESAPQVVTTGPLPDEVPGVTVDGDVEGDFVLLPSTGTPNWILLLDGAGRVVWYHRDDRGLSVFRARVAADGTGIVYSSVIELGFASPDSEVVRVSWDGSVETATAVPDLAHDFVEEPDGRVVSLAFEVQDGVEGNALVRIAPDGTTETLWTTFDCFDPIENPGDDPLHGWTHANALDAADDGWIVGLRNLATLARVTSDGSCPWGFGGAGGTIDLSGTRFIHQHQFEHSDGKMLVFDNDGAPGNASRVIEYDFDEAAGAATEARVFEADPPLYSFILGDVHREADGDTWVVWASPQTVDRYGPDGARVWRSEIAGTGPLGFSEIVPPEVLAAAR
jgi:hypothetical protein